MNNYPKLDDAGIPLPDRYDSTETRAHEYGKTIEERGSTATLTFPLPEMRYEFNTAANAIDLAIVLNDVDRLCRDVLKHDTITDVYKLAERIREEITDVRHLID